MMLSEVETQLTPLFSSGTKELSRETEGENAATNVKQVSGNTPRKFQKQSIDKKDAVPKDGSPSQTQPGSAIVASQMFKTKLCIDNQTKGCTRGDRCPYAHSVSEMRNLPDLRKTKMCALVLAGKRCKNRSCSFAHSEDELRYTCGFAEFKTQICRFAEEHGGRGCLYGTRCPYAHSPLEIRPLETPTVAPTEILVEQKKTNSSKPKSFVENFQKDQLREQESVHPPQGPKIVKPLYKDFSSEWRPQQRTSPTATRAGASHGQRSRVPDGSWSSVQDRNRNNYLKASFPRELQKGETFSSNPRFPTKLSSGKRIPTSSFHMEETPFVQDDCDGNLPIARNDINSNQFNGNTTSAQKVNSSTRGNTLGNFCTLPNTMIENHFGRDEYSNLDNIPENLKRDSFTDSTLWDPYSNGYPDVFYEMNPSRETRIDAPPGLKPIYDTINQAPKMDNFVDEVDIESQLESFAAAMRKFESCDRISLLQLQQEFISELQRRENTACLDSSNATEHNKDLICLEKAAASFQ